MTRQRTQKLDLAARQVRQQAEKDFRYYNVKRFILHPGQWAKCNLAGIVLNWQKVKFDAANKNAVPNNAIGVYSFVIEPGIANHPSVQYLMYVGMTDRQHFRARYDKYLQEPEQPKRENIAEMIEKWSNQLWFYYATVPTGTDVQKLEEALIASFMPPYNRAFPADIRKTIMKALS